MSSAFAGVQCFRRIFSGTIRPNDKHKKCEVQAETGAETSAPMGEVVATRRPTKAAHRRPTACCRASQAALPIRMPSSEKEDPAVLQVDRASHQATGLRTDLDTLDTRDSSRI